MISRISSSEFSYNLTVGGDEDPVDMPRTLKFPVIYLLTRFFFLLPTDLIVSSHHKSFACEPKQDCNAWKTVWAEIRKSFYCNMSSINLYAGTLVHGNKTAGHIYEGRRYVNELAIEETNQLQDR